MGIYLIYDICAVMALATLILALVARGLYKGRSNKQFLILCVILLLAGILDIAGEYMDNIIAVHEAWQTPVRYLINLLYYLLHNLMSPLYFLYIASIIGIWYKTKRNSLLVYLWLVPYNLDIILLIINIANHKMFYFDEDLNFVHGPWFMVLYAVAFYYMFFEIAVLTRYKRLVSTPRFWLLLSMLPLNGIAVIVQYLFPEFRIEIMTTTIIIIEIAITVHRPEDMMDDLCGMQSYNAFLGNVHTSYVANAPVSYLMIRINN